jgi:hypothetical protein
VPPIPAPYRLLRGPEQTIASDRPTFVHRCGCGTGLVALRVYDVTRAIAVSGADIRSAHVSTLGAECVDVFYLTDSDGSPLEDEDALTTAKSVLDRLS